MMSVEFPEANDPLAEDQPEYETLYCHVPVTENGLCFDPQVPFTFCMQLNAEELAEIARTGRLWITQSTFGQPFQPIRMSTEKPF